MSNFNIITVPNDILRSKCIPITYFDQNTRNLLHEMAQIMYAANGIGLAAPQIGLDKQAIVIDIGDGIIKLINPVILESFGSQDTFEGCLSVPGKCVHAKRPAQITVSGLNEDGKEILIHAENELAIVLCHEIDHLNGVLFTDIANEIFNMTCEKLQQIKQ